MIKISTNAKGQFSGPMNIPDSQIEDWKLELAKNLSIYKDVLKVVQPCDINKDADKVCEECFKKGDIIGGSLQKNFYKQRWVDVGYRTLVAWVSITYQLWEQQLVQCVELFFKELKLESLGYKHPRNRDGIKKIFDQPDKGVNFTDLRSWKKIDEMRLLVNIIKHAEGGSEEDLKRVRPDVFRREIDPIDGNTTDVYVLSGTHSSIGIPSLNITDKDLEEYSKALIDFWIEINGTEIIIESIE